MPRLHRVAVGMAALLFSASLIAAEPTVTFKVQASDTLIGLSNTVLVSAAAWREVATLNRLKNPNRITPGQELQVPLRLLRSKTVPAMLVSVSGDVRVGEPGQMGVGGQTAAVVGMPIREGQRLQTGPNGSVVLEFADGSRMKLPPSSLAEVMSSRQYGEREPSVPTAGAEVAVGGAKGLFSGLLRLLQGSVEVFATKVLRAKPLEISTPTAVVGVRGTHYRVSYSEADNRITRTEVLDGRVRTDVATPGDSNASKAPIGVDVPAAFGAWLDASARPPVSVPMLPAPDLGGVPARFERPLVRFVLPGETQAVRVQVASDASFDRIASDLTVAPGTDVRIAGLDDGAWFVRARRLDAKGLEGFDATRPFVLKARPEPPATSAPRPNAKQGVGAVEFQWAANLQAQRYHLQVARDAAFKDMVLDRPQASAPREQADLPTEGTYHWRVASIKADGDKGPFGDAQGFELRPNPEPPRGGLVGDSLQLNWSGRSGDKQQVELASDADFKTIVARDELTAAQWNVPAPGTPGTYYFRYRSVEPDGFTTRYSSTLAIEVPRDWRHWLLVVPFLFLL